MRDFLFTRTHFRSETKIVTMFHRFVRARALWMPLTRAVAVRTFAVASTLTVATAAVAVVGAPHAWSRERSLFLVAAASTTTNKDRVAVDASATVIVKADQLFDQGQSVVPEMYALLKSAVVAEPFNAVSCFCFVLLLLLLCKKKCEFHSSRAVLTGIIVALVSVRMFSVASCGWARLCVFAQSQ